VADQTPQTSTTQTDAPKATAPQAVKPQAPGARAARPPEPIAKASNEPPTQDAIATSNGTSDAPKVAPVPSSAASSVVNALRARLDADVVRLRVLDVMRRDTRYVFKEVFD
jgi:hypothetical protein